MDMSGSNFEAVVVDMTQEAVSDIKLFAAHLGDDYSVKVPPLLFYSHLNLSSTYFFYFFARISTYLVPHESFIILWGNSYESNVQTQ